jgi:ADP-ribose pyrophosphatase YjhB (NUDIX family)
MPHRPSDPQICRCPRCSGSDLAWHSPNNFECPACSFMLFLNVAAAVAVIIESRGKILFGIRKNDPGRGMLDLPGGFVDPGESAEECARREVREETGVDIPGGDYFTSLPNTYLYREIVYNTLDIVLTVTFDEPPAVHAGDDLAELLWIERSEIDFDRIAFPSLGEAVRRYLAAT